MPPLERLQYREEDNRPDRNTDGLKLFKKQFTRFATRNSETIFRLPPAATKAASSHKWRSPSLSLSMDFEDDPESLPKNVIEKKLHKIWKKVVLLKDLDMIISGSHYTTIIFFTVEMKSE